MMHYRSLTRTTERLINFLEEYRNTRGDAVPGDFEPLFQTIQHIFPQWVLMTCPAKHTEFRFITENCDNVLGFSMEAYKAAKSPDFLFSFIHEDDIEPLYQCLLYVDSFLKNCLPDEYPKMRCIFQYRFKKRDDSYITLHDEKLMMSLNGNGNFFYCMIKDITNDTVFTGVKVEIFRQHTVVERIGFFKPQDIGNNLSKRETELVGLLKRGLTTKEVAYQLNISQYTVRNIKQKMFEKYKVNNVVELLNKTVHYN
jgi:DNA-binding CsgD family transcriptional regulator